MSGNEIQKIASIASKFLCPIQIKKSNAGDLESHTLLL